VNLTSLITLEDSLPLFLPELALCGTIVLMLLVRVVKGGQHVPPFLLALAGSMVALWLALPREGLETWAAIDRQELFTGMLVYDTLTASIRVFLISFVVLFIVGPFDGACRSRRWARFLCPRFWRNDRHVCHGLGQPSAHYFYGRRDGECPLLRVGGYRERSPAQ